MAQASHCGRPWYMRPPVWILGIVLLGLAAFGIVEMIGTAPVTPYGAFLDQLEAGNVASVTFRGTQIDGHFKNPISNASANGAQQTAFRSRVPDFGDPSLLAELRKQHVVIDVVASSNWVSLVGRLPWPMVIFFAFILIAGFARLVRGGRASSGSEMQMPMHGLIGMVSGLFAKQNPPESGAAREAGTKS